MAFDKLVDSAQLESALTATANAIRGKTGGTDKIAWASDTGFKSAVEAISAGSGSVEACTVTVTVYNMGCDVESCTFSYNGQTALGTRTFESNSYEQSTDMSVVKNTLLVVDMFDDLLNYSVSGEVYDWLSAENILVFEVCGDGAIKLTGNVATD